MKNMILCMLVALVCAGASAQKLEWSVNAGIGTSQWMDDDANDCSQAGTAYKIGIGAGYSFSKVWSLHTGLNLIGYNTDMNHIIIKNDRVASRIEADINQLYLDVPVMAGARLRLSDKLNLMLKAGPYFSYGIGGKKTLKGEEKENTFGKDGMNRFDSGFVFEVDLEISHFTVGLEGRAGWTKLFDDEDVEVYNSAGFLSIGYRF